MSEKFGRIQAFVEELETVELINEEDSLMLQGSAGVSSTGSGNNCKCNSNNCDCNTTFTCQP